jgi:hypothetical protein
VSYRPRDEEELVPDPRRPFHPHDQKIKDLTDRPATRRPPAREAPAGEREEGEG